MCGIAQEPRELVMGALYQAGALQEALNEALTVSDSDVVAVKASQVRASVGLI